MHMDSKPPLKCHNGTQSKAPGLLSAAIEFGPKITELWAKNTCPYMGARTILDCKWANFNIFA